MNKRLENKLFKKYPKLFPNGRKVDSRKSLMTFGFECDDGWYWLIDKLSEDIQNYTDNNLKHQPIVVQVKEKMGGLRYYLENGHETIHGMIWFAESLSYSICEKCGSLEGKPNDKGWIKTLCPKCRKELKR